MIVMPKAIRIDRMFGSLLYGIFFISTPRFGDLFKTFGMLEIVH